MADFHPDTMEDQARDIPGVQVTVDGTAPTAALVLAHRIHFPQRHQAQAGITVVGYLPHYIGERRSQGALTHQNQKYQVHTPE